MHYIIVATLAALPWDAGSECSDVCCKAFTASCLACNMCVTVEEYCRRAPDTFGCKSENASHSKALEPVFNSTADLVLNSSKLKFNLSDAGFEYFGRFNPIVQVLCNSTEDCDLQIEVEQKQANKTCVLTFEDVSSNICLLYTSPSPRDS